MSNLLNQTNTQPSSLADRHNTTGVSKYLQPYQSTNLQHEDTNSSQHSDHHQSSATTNSSINGIINLSTVNTTITDEESSTITVDVRGVTTPKPIRQQCAHGADDAAAPRHQHMTDDCHVGIHGTVGAWNGVRDETSDQVDKVHVSKFS